MSIALQLLAWIRRVHTVGAQLSGDSPGWGPSAHPRGISAALSDTHAMQPELGSCIALEEIWASISWLTVTTGLHASCNPDAPNTLSRIAQRTEQQICIRRSITEHPICARTRRPRILHCLGHYEGFLLLRCLIGPVTECLE